MGRASRPRTEALARRRRRTTTSDPEGDRWYGATELPAGNWQRLFWTGTELLLFLDEEEELDITAARGARMAPPE